MVRTHLHSSFSSRSHYASLARKTRLTLTKREREMFKGPQCDVFRISLVLGESSPCLLAVPWVPEVRRHPESYIRIIINNH